jgi:WD40 repeat protein
MTTIAAGTQTGNDNPYVGPIPILAGKPFYGREVETRDLFNLLVAERIVLLYSPSGAGKTSLIEAGLVPALELEQFTVLPRIRLHQSSTGAGPTVVDGNRYVSSALWSLECQLEARHRPALGHTTLPHYLDDLRARQDAAYQVLVIDQFEEVLSVDPGNLEAKRRFFEELGAALEDRSRWALLAMREDYLASLEPFMRQVPTDLATRFRLGLLEGEYARMAIRQPAVEREVAFDGKAVDQLYDDLTGGGYLVEPVHLQVVCRRLWERRANPDRIDVDDVVRSGTVDDALMDFVDKAIGQAAAGTGLREREIRDWFEQSLLTKLGHRQPASVGPGEDEATSSRALEVLVACHVVREEPRPTGTWYELAHDRLVDPVLKSNERWREGALSKLQLQAGEWLKHNRQDDYLLQGQALDDAERWAEGNEQELTEEERQYLDACRHNRQRQRRNARRRRFTVFAAVLFLALAIVALLATRRARQQERIAREQTLVGLGLRNLTVDPELSVLLGLKAGQLSRQRRGDIGPEARDLLYRAVAASRVRETFTVPPPSKRAAPKATQQRIGGLVGGQQPTATRPAYGLNDASLNRTGQVLAAAAENGRVVLWRVAGAEYLRELSGPSSSATRVAFDPAGRNVAVGRSDGSVSVINMASGAATSVHLTDSVVDLAFSPTGSQLAVALRLAPTVVLHQSGNGWARLRSPVAFAHAVAFSPDGRLLATGGVDGMVWLWRADRGGKRRGVQAHTSDITSVAFSPDGRLLATGSLDGMARIWETSGLRRLATLSGHTNGVRRVAFSPDGGRVATASLDGTARVWDATSGRELLSLLGHTKEVTAAVFDPSGATLITTSLDGTARSWTVAVGHTGYVTSIAFSPEQQLLVTGSADGTARLWYAQTFEQLKVYRGHHAQVAQVAISPDGNRLATAGLDGTVRIWALTGVGPPLVLHQPGRSRTPMYAVAFNSTGTRLATVGGDGRAVIWDPASGRPVGKPLIGHTGPVRDVAFSPNGRRLMTAGDDQTAKVWDLRSGRLFRNLRDDTGAVLGVAYRDDRTVATASIGGTVSIWEVDTGRRLQQLSGHTSAVSDVDFSPNGKLLASASWDHTVRIWDIAHGVPKVLAVIEQPAEINSVAFSPDSQNVATASSDKSFRVLPLVDKGLLSRAAEQVTRSLTPNECELYLANLRCAA